jgi:GNAT superfamily N-acetyltransferase
MSETHVADFRSLSETQAEGLRLRDGRFEDAETCGSICYGAFKAIAYQHNFTSDFPSPEIAIGLVASLLSRGDIYSVVAEVDGRVVGSNFLWENGAIAGVGPITIDPSAQNVAIGRRLMEEVLRRAKERNFAGVRLVQAAYHNRSLSLYTKLGFDVREPLSNLQGPPIEPPPSDIRQYFREWLDHDGHPFWPFWENVRTWWEFRDLPNVLFVHFASLKRDMPGQIRRIAEFLEVPVDETRWETILEYCSFEWMKRHATKSVPLGGAFWDAGAQVFINKGVNGRWAETLTPEDVAEYEARAVQELGPECARWLATGEEL